MNPSSGNNDAGAAPTGRGLTDSEGTWGGHVIEGCDVFDTVLETGDHGSFNSWGRDRYWHPSIAEVDRQVAADPRLPFLDVIEPIVLRNNRWRCDHGWDVDLDDGSSRYRIADNLFLNGGVEVNQNLFTTREADRLRFAAQGCDADSLVADPRFVDPARGDSRVQPDSPALTLGFQNFPMDRFGVRRPELRALARTPALPTVRIEPDRTSPVTPSERSFGWRGARIREIEGEEFSAYGVTKESGGIAFASLRENGQAFKDGFRGRDLIQSVNGQRVRCLADFVRALTASSPGQPVRFEIVRNQSTAVVTLTGPVEVPRL